ncbi:MAG: response regulator [Oceanospirillaceae bacterium]|nr:response regulator [Oceanospirillaceae bacterium]
MKIVDNSSAGLNKQILLVTLTPLVVLSILFTLYLFWSKSLETENLFLQRGNTIVQLMSVEAKEAIMQNDLVKMQQLSKAPLKVKDVADVVFLSLGYNILHRTASFPLNLKTPAPAIYNHDSHSYFVQAVTTHSQVTTLFNSANQNLTSTEIIGWVVVLLDRDEALTLNRSLFIKIAIGIIFMLLIAFWFASRFARQIMLPIAEITSVVDAFQKGNFDARARNTHVGKLTVLATGINRMAMRIKVSTTDMETRVDSATRRLQSAMHHLEQQNETLELTKEKEVEANQAKDQFLARMSHELRTPLTSILGFSKILQDTKITEDQAEPIRIINHTSQLLLSIVDDILDYSKLQKDAITLERIDFNLETAILDIMEMQAPMAHSKGLELSLLSSNGRSFDIKGDPTRFKQIISNLVSNAIKFTDTGSVAISADIQHISSHQSLIIISVTDTGIGISNEQLNKLFKAFVQADTSITRRFGGSGLGLVIAKTLTKLMGGKLEIYSKQGRGTNVTLQIPILSNTPLQAEYPSDYQPAETVLIYDENQHTRRSISLLLTRKNINHKSALNQADLLKSIASYRHLVIGISSTDVNNLLVKQVLPLLNDSHKSVTIALPSNHSMPILPTVVSIINKPIRPETLFPSKGKHAPDANSDISQQTSHPAICAVVAEDNAFNQILIGKILEKHQIKTYIASNGKEAIELIAKYQPDIAIIDIHMPVMDGFEATRIIRQSSDMPIISLTANIIEKDHKKITAAGSNHIVLKPINDVELISTIRRLTAAATQKKLRSSAQKNEQESTSRQPGIKPQPATNLADYDLDQTVLNDELLRLLGLLQSEFSKSNIHQMRELAHQLVGLAGLYELPEVELTTIELQNVLKANDTRQIWTCLSRLMRIVEHSNEIQPSLF